MSLSTLAARIQYLGGSQLDRIKTQKLRSLRMALRNDYNSYVIDTPLRGAWHCLMNTDHLEPDYDKKRLSVELDSGLEAGDVFTRLIDDTRWMVMLPVLTETAYLRSQAIRCRYTVDIDGREWWVYFRGGIESRLKWVSNRTSNFIDSPNTTGRIFVKNTPETVAFFKRFKKVRIDGHNWQVQVTDPISSPGILEVEVLEYFDDKYEDMPEIKPEPHSTDPIRGPKVVRRGTLVGYAILESKYDAKYEWKVSGNKRVSIKRVVSDGRICEVDVPDGTVGSFVVSFGPFSRTVTVDWESDVIGGPTRVYPYSTNIYVLRVKGATDVTFKTDDQKVAVVSKMKDDSCVVDVRTGRTGSFNLTCSYKLDGVSKTVMILITVASM